VYVGATEVETRH